VRVQLNSRALLEETLRAGVLRGRPEVFAPLCVIIDKLAKIGADAVREQLSDPAGPVGLAPSEAGDVVSLLQLRDLEAAAAAAPPGSAAVRDLLRLFELLDAYGIAGKVDFDASVVRGLAYYTGIVFEAYDSERKLRAVCGGGRYDGLLETLGGPPIPAVGFGFGDVVIGELLADRGLLPALPRGLEDVVAALGEAQRPAAIRLACGLRARGRAVELLLGDARPKRVLEDADRAGAQRVLFVGPDEAARGVARVRTLATGAESEEPIP
jgi:histidyl-tRNA synthetase